MELQRILAKDSRSAMEQVHQKYGIDALVVSNKRANNKTELIIAIDLEDDSEVVLEELQVKGEPMLNDKLEQYPAFDQVMESKVFKTVPDDTTSIKPLVSFIPSCDVAEKSSTDAGSEAREYLHAREIVDLVKEELAVLRRELKLSGQMEAWGRNQFVSEPMKPLIKSLDDSGMPLSLQAMVVDIVNQSVTHNEALDGISTTLGQNIANVNILSEMQGIHVITGSSGSGKTLMSARLANQKALEYGEHDIALISFKDTRFGAWSQVQLLGAQAGVDTFRVNSDDALEQLVAELSSRKLVLIDTPGVDVASTMNTLTALLPNAKYHLVVSADASEGGISKYIKMNNGAWTSIMLSRLANDIQPWPLINVLLKENIAVSLAAGVASITDPAASISGVSLLKTSLSGLPLSFV
ncbi:MAG: flagellar biosynthesis protein FlhF [Porticoccaceae bacterium]|jgi:flagellar biosynthesis protein FlhF|tara:strand:+ start:2373 stop:3602 length:1230 start_codon:yes stop_codon:yes gene_type:complete